MHYWSCILFARQPSQKRRKKLTLWCTGEDKYGKYLMTERIEFSDFWKITQLLRITRMSWAFFRVIVVKNNTSWSVSNQMKIIVFIFIILHWLTALTAIRIPFVRNVTLVLKFDWNTTTLQNHTCIECLCSTVLTNVTALNCFSNNTCQFFFTVPRTYNLQHTPQTFLYFPNGIFPNAS